MNIVETLFSILPLPVGNITVTVLLLALVYLVATLILEAGIRLVKFTLAADDEDAPEYKIDNALINLMKKLPLNSMRIVKDSSGFYVKGLWYYLDRETHARYLWDYKCICTKFHCYEAAERRLEVYKGTHPVTLYGVTRSLIALLVLDVILFLFSVAFIPTVCITGIVGLIFTIRFLSKKFYKTAKKHGNHLTKHDIEIDELKEKINER